MNVGNLHNDQPGLDELVAQIDRETIEALRLLPQEDDKSEMPVQRLELGRHVAVELGGLRLAIPQRWVIEAGVLTYVEPLPLLPDWILGVTNVRGVVVSVVDLRLFFDLGAKELRSEHPFLMLSNNNFKTILVGDAVIGARAVYQNDQGGESGSLMGKSMENMENFVVGRAVCEGKDGEEEIYLFDVEGFLSSPQMMAFSKV